MSPVLGALNRQRRPVIASLTSTCSLVSRARPGKLWHCCHARRRADETLQANQTSVCVRVPRTMLNGMAASGLGLFSPSQTVPLRVKGFCKASLEREG